MPEEQIAMPLDFQPEEVRTAAIEILRKNPKTGFAGALKEAFVKLDSDYKDHTSMYLLLLPEIRAAAREMKQSKYPPKGIESDQF